MSLPELFTPEDIEVRIPAITAHYVRRVCRERLVEHLRLDRRRIAMTEAQIVALVLFATAKPDLQATGVDSLLTPRSRARKRSS